MSPRGGLLVNLEGAPKPISFLLVAGADRYDANISVNVGYRGPNARVEIDTRPGAPVTGAPYLTAMLSGIAPADAVPLTVTGVSPDDVRAWRLGNHIYLRTRHTLMSPPWDASQYGEAGVTIYAIPPTPVVLLSVNSRTVSAELEGVAVMPNGVVRRRWGSPFNRVASAGPMRLVIIGGSIVLIGAVVIGVSLISADAPLQSSATRPVNLNPLPGGPNSTPLQDRVALAEDQRQAERAAQGNRSYTPPLAASQRAQPVELVTSAGCSISTAGEGTAHAGPRGRRDSTGAGPSHPRPAGDTGSGAVPPSTTDDGRGGRSGVPQFSAEAP